MRISDWSSDVCSSDLVDAGQWHKAQKPEYNQGAQGKPKALLEIGRLRKFRKAYTGCHLVGSRCHICLKPRSITAPGGVPESLAAEAVPVELFNIRSFFEHVQWPEFEQPRRKGGFPLFRPCAALRQNLSQHAPARSIGQEEQVHPGPKT